MTTTVLDQLTEDALTGRSSAAGEASWLRDRRLVGFKRYLDLDWPDSRRDEYWRSTPFKKFTVDLPIIAGDTTGLGTDGLPAIVADATAGETAVVRIRDGAVVDVDVSEALAEQGVVIASLADAASGDHAELVKTHLGSLTTTNADGTGADEDRTVAVNDAAWTAGVFVYVPPEVELDSSIGIHVHVDTPGAHLPRVLVVVDRFASAKLYLEHTGADLGDERALVDEVAEFVLLDGSRLDVATLQEWSDQVDHLSLQKAAVHRDATYRHLSVNIGGKTVRLRPEVDLLGPGASTFPLGIYFADEGQHFDLQPYLRHLTPRATSDVLYKGALQGRCRTVFRGNVFVRTDAVGTDTNETNRTLILTDGARADSTPFLEIECADITAGHGSATGQIDARHLFYLEARGIPRAEALRLIVFGFFTEVLDKLQMPGVHDRALAHIEREVETSDLDAIGVSEAALLPSSDQGGIG